MKMGNNTKYLKYKVIDTGHFHMGLELLIRQAGVTEEPGD